MTELEQIIYILKKLNEELEDEHMQEVRQYFEEQLELSDKHYLAEDLS